MALWGLLPRFSGFLSLVVQKSFSKLFCLFFFKNFSFLFAQSRLTFQVFFWNAWFELLRTLVVDSHGGITLATLRDVNL